MSKMTALIIQPSFSEDTKTPDSVPAFYSNELYAAFLRRTLAPERRASLMPIAIACLRLFALLRPPDLNFP